MKLLPKWSIPEIFNAVYDVESATAIEQTAKLYGAMQNLITEYNDFADRVNTTIENFVNDNNESNEVFRVDLRQEFQDFIDIIDLKYKNQNNIINDAVTYLKNNLETFVKSNIDAMRKNGTFDKLTQEIFQDLFTKVNELNTRVNNITSLEEGSTTGDLELTDARIDYRGTAHSNVGTHIRTIHKESISRAKDITDEMENYVVDIETSINLLSNENYTDEMINANGEIEASDTYVLTDFLKCKGQRLICYTRNTSGNGTTESPYVRDKDFMKAIAFYDKNKNMISFISISYYLLSEKDILTPYETEYVRFCFFKSYIPYKTMLEYSENGISSKYVPFKETTVSYNENIDNKRMESVLKSFTTHFPEPKTPEFIKKSGLYNGCLSDIKTLNGKDILYGFSGNSVVRSGNENNLGSPNIIMTSLPSGTSATVNFIKKLDDGTLLVGVENAHGEGIAKVYKGTPETWDSASSKFITTWTEVLACETSGIRFSMWFGLSIYKNFIILAEYGSNNVARNVYFSNDYGNTWKKIFTPELDNNGAGVHIHDVCYDPYSRVIWICTGDGHWANNIYFSYNGGLSWHKNYEYKEQPSQFTQILPLPNCILFVSDDSRHMAVYRAERSQVHEMKTHINLEFAYAYDSNYNAESPIATNGAIAYGKNACVFFGWIERFDVTKTKAPLIATNDGYNFYKIWENETLTSSTNGYNGIYGVYGVTDNGNIGVSLTNLEEGTTHRHSIIMQIPTWKNYYNMFE